jgi:hypothetical protein
MLVVVKSDIAGAWKPAVPAVSRRRGQGGDIETIQDGRAVRMP